MLEGSYKSENKNGNASDAELDALLAEWTEAEIEPPAGFHEQTMNRLRKETQLKKKNHIIPLFVKHKRWGSIAAAVLLLFCVSMMQGQIGSDEAEAVRDTEVQIAQNDSTNGTRIGMSSDNTSKATDNTHAVQKQDSAGEADASIAEQSDMKTVMSTVIVPEIAQDSDENGIAVAQLPVEDTNVPMTAAFSLEDELHAIEDASVNNSARMIEEASAAYSVRNAGETLEQLEQKLTDLEAQMLDYQAQLAQHPEDVALQELVTEQQSAIAELKQKIEDRKAEEISQQAE